MSFFLKEVVDVALHILFKRSFQILGALKAKLVDKVFDCLIECGMERRNCQVFLIELTTLGNLGATAERQGSSKVARRTTVKKFTNQCCGFDHTVVIDRQPMESL